MNEERREWMEGKESFEMLGKMKGGGMWSDLEELFLEVGLLEMWS